MSFFCTLEIHSKNKYTMRLFFLFVVLTGTSYAQIGLAQLQWMYKADLDAFETKAIEENYKFDEIVKTTNFAKKNNFFRTTFSTWIDHSWGNVSRCSRGTCTAVSTPQRRSTVLCSPHDEIFD